MSIIRNNRKILAIVCLGVAGVIVASVLGNQAFVATASTQDQSQMSSTGEDKSADPTMGQQGAENGAPAWLFAASKKYQDYEDGVFKVKAGVGNHVGPLTWFFPQNAQIKVGETVVWNNPTKVEEPHTVTFMKDPASFAPIEAPFIISNSTNVVAVDPTSNVSPTLAPGPNGSTIAIIANARSYSPVSINGGIVTNLPPNANYTMTGNEGFVNSGWIWPAGQTPPGLQEISSFSVKFEKAGTYPYMCLIHPWMAGIVTVS